nr:hypothetical protein [Tanacetum cinerariifolium]
MMIKGDKIQKSNKKTLKAKGKGKANGKGKDKQVYIPKPKNPKPATKEHPTKDDTCHHCKEVGHSKRNCPAYLDELIKKKKQVGTASNSDIFVIELFSLPSKSWVYDTSCGTLICNTQHGLRGVRKLKQIEDKCLQHEGLLKSIDDESFDQCVSCLPGKMTRKLFPHRPERVTDLLGIIHTYVCGPLRHVSRQDRGGEYISQEFKDYFKACRIVQQLTPPYTPQHNGVSERRNHTLLDMVRSMINLTTLPLSFWDYALESATRILNMVPTKKVDKTPYKLWCGKVPNLSYLKVWGCEALVKRDTPDKLQQRSFKCIFIDLEEILDEHTSPSGITSKIPIEVKGFEPPQEEVILIRRSERIHRAPNRLCLNTEVEKHSLGDLNKPASYKPAMLDLESNKWIDAMNAEIQSMIENMAWVLVDLPPGCKTVGTKGYTQPYGVDYEETFLPVADIRAIRILISIAAYYDYEIWKMDVKNAFLNSYLEEDIYMVQPEGFFDPNHPRKVCKRQRSIYGLKQASRSWNKRFDEEIKKFGFAQNLDEPCVYQKASRSNVTFLIYYVDDIIIMGNHIPSLQCVKDYLGKCFAMKDLGEVAFILGIKVHRDRSKRLIGLGQNAYMEKILKIYKMDNSKCGHIPMQERLDMNKTQGASTPKEVKRMQNVPYASAVGSIMYAVRCTRPDVAFTQNITSCFQQNAGECH